MSSHGNKSRLPSYNVSYNETIIIIFPLFIIFNSRLGATKLQQTLKRHLIRLYRKIMCLLHNLDTMTG